jgi:hypothetical protein
VQGSDFTNVLWQGERFHAQHQWFGECRIADCAVQSVPATNIIIVHKHSQLSAAGVLRLSRECSGEEMR